MRIHSGSTLRAAIASSLMALALTAGACSKKPAANDSTSTPSAAPSGEPGAGGTMSKEDCEQKGGHTVGDIGDGSVKCGEGEESAGRVQLGMEGALCCVPSGGAAGQAKSGGGGW